MKEKGDVVMPQLNKGGKFVFGLSLFSRSGPFAPIVNAISLLLIHNNSFPILRFNCSNSCDVNWIQPDLTVQFPTQALEEYQVLNDDKIIIFTGSKVTGGFCVTN